MQTSRAPTSTATFSSQVPSTVGAVPLERSALALCATKVTSGFPASDIASRAQGRSGPSRRAGSPRARWRSRPKSGWLRVQRASSSSTAVRAGEAGPRSSPQRCSIRSPAPELILHRDSDRVSGLQSASSKIRSEGRRQSEGGLAEAIARRRLSRDRTGGHLALRPHDAVDRGVAPHAGGSGRTRINTRHIGALRNAGPLGRRRTCGRRCSGPAATGASRQQRQPGQAAEHHPDHCRPACSTVVRARVVERRAQLLTPRESARRGAPGARQPLAVSAVA